MNHGAKRAVTHLLRQKHHRCQFPQLSLRLQRCSSTFEKREWSTPLAKTIAEAIRVCITCLLLSTEQVCLLAVCIPDHRPHLDRSVHAPMPHQPRGRILHDAPRRLREARGLHHVARDHAGVWRADWRLDGRGVDGAGAPEQRGGVDRIWAGEGDVDG